MGDWTGEWAYGYDSMNRLTNATVPAPIPNQPAGGSGTLAYGYDWVGNRVRPPADPTPPSNAHKMVYNEADQLTSWPGMRQYTYYSDGSLQHVTNAGGTSTLATYAYTPDGLLSQATFNGKTLTNTWDASQQRVGMTVNSTDYEFVYDAVAGIPAVIEEVSAGSTSTTTTRYFREPNGSLIARVEDSSVHYYHFDALGSTRLLTNADADITDRYAYDAYGALISHDRTANSVAQPYQYVGQLGYYTHWQEPELGLLQLGVRFYDAETGRFTQTDVLRNDSRSPYCYSNGAPTTTVDPSGKVCYRCWRDLEPPIKWWPAKHEFIYCDLGNDGYDGNDPMIGMGSNSICSDFDRQYLNTYTNEDRFDVRCTKLPDSMTKCLIRRIEKDMWTKCFGKFNWCWNNCQEYVTDMIGDCK